MAIRILLSVTRASFVSTVLSISLLGSLLSSEASAQSAPQTALYNSPVATAKYYEAADAKLIWTEAADFQDLLTALEGLRAQGLTPEDYHLSQLQTMPSGTEARDRLATDAWMSAAAHMLHGKLNPLSVEPDWTAARREADLPRALTVALATNGVAKSLDAFAPSQPSYAALKSELATLTRQAAQDVTLIPPGETLKLGMKTPRVEMLKMRLAELGYLGAGEGGNALDDVTVEAVKAFQSASDLDADGAVGLATLAALNRGLEGKINQLRINMERWRWLPNDLGKRHLRANIAGFDVTAWNEGKVESRHLTVVGRTYRKTPVFSDSVKYLVFNPWWETPNSLATRDKLPTFRKDPSAVERLGFQILNRQGQVVPATSINWNEVSGSNFPYRIRQRPGELNALGQVKIMFPNKHNVYLHDTPTKGLFAQRQRAFSSGCLRTENPIGLSEWLLSETDGWDRVRIDTALATGKETRANLKAPVPVHILYFTAVNEGSYGVRYLDDIYDRDSKVLAGLNQKAKPR